MFMIPSNFYLIVTFSICFSLLTEIAEIIHMNDVPSISYIMPQDSVHFFNLCGDIMICTKAETLLIQSLLSLLTTSNLKSKEDPHFFCEVT